MTTVLSSVTSCLTTLTSLVDVKTVLIVSCKPLATKSASADVATLVLSSEFVDDDVIVSVESDNQFRLQAGKYWVTWRAPASMTNGHVSLLYNDSDSAFVQIGSTEFTGNGAGSEIQTCSFGSAQIDISSEKDFEIQHYAQTTKSNIGFGMDQSDAPTGDSIYTIVEIRKEA